MSFVSKIKSVFKPKAPLYKHYQPSELKIIAMRTRLILEEVMKKCGKKIQDCDHLLAERKDMAHDSYKIMQEIGKNVIEYESMKIYMEILRKIEDKASLIIKTNGDIALLKTELQWFQSILWYRKCRQATNMEQLYNFCYNFFKGIDVTMEINVKCDIFTIYDVLRYLDPKCILPLKKLYPVIIHYISTEIQRDKLQQIFKMNKEQIKIWFRKQKIELEEKFISKSKSKSPLKNKKVSPRPKQHSTNMTQSYRPPEMLQRKESEQANRQIMRRQYERSQEIKEIKRVEEREFIEIKNQGQKGDNDNDYDEQDSERRKKQEAFKNSFMRRMKPGKCSVDVNVGEIDNLQNKQERVSKTEEFVIPEETAYFGKKKDGHDVNEEKRGFKEEQEKEVRIEEIQSIFRQRIDEEAEENENKQKGRHGIVCHSCGQTEADETITPSMINLLQPEIINNIDMSFGLSRSLQANNKKLCRKCFDQLMNKSNKIEEENKVNTSELQIFQQKIQQAQPLPEPEQIFDDEKQSLEFIRSSLKEKKKRIKKPYMVSIYARGEFMNQF